MSDRIEIPEDWHIEGDAICICWPTRGDLSVRVVDGELVIEGGAVDNGLVEVPLIIVHAATKLAEVTAILDQERSRLLAERFEGR